MAAECGSFGAALREHRVRRGLTQQTVAELADVSVRTVQALEQGHTREPEPSTAARLAVAVRLLWPPSDVPLPPVRPPAQLPMDARGFVGRKRQLDVLDELASGGRPVVVTGTAGVGKTALGVRWSHHARPRFPDGQLYADLRGYTTGKPMRVDEVVGRFLRGFGLPAEQVPAEPEQALVLYQSLLANRKMLVLLDNAGDAEQVRDLVPDNPDCLALVTSRDRVDGLDAGRLDLDVLDGDEARVLLCETLGADRVDEEPFAATELAELCAFLPLALRVAAANLADQPGLPIAEHVASLQEGSLLANLAVDGDPHAAVRAAFDLSYRRLSEEDQQLFGLLGLVPGQDFTARAASALLGAPAEDGLRRLASAHLVHEHAPGRYAFHDLLRLYAAELSTGDTPAGLYDWYLGNACAALRLQSPESIGLPMPELPADDFAGPAAAMAWLDAEMGNVTAAITDCRFPSLHERAWQLSDRMRSYYWTSGNFLPWRAACEAVLKLAGDNLMALASAHFALTGACTRLNDYQRSLWHGEQALALARECDWRILESATLGTMAALTYELGRMDEALRYGKAAVALGEELDAPSVVANSMVNLGSTYLDLGDYEEALACCQRGYEIAGTIDARYVEALSLGAVGTVHRKAGRPEEALRCLTSTIATLEELGDTAYVGRALFNLAETQVDLGDLDAALATAERAVEVTPQGGDHMGMSDSHRVLGRVLTARGETRRAQEHNQRALVLARHLVHRHVRGLQQVPCPFHALLRDPPAGARPGLLAEPAGERADAHPRLVGQRGQLQRFVEPLQRPRAGGCGRRVAELGHRALDELRLAALPPRRHDAVARHLVRDFAAVVGADHVQHQVDARRDARGRQHVAVVHEQHVRVQVDPRVHPAEVVRAAPVRRRRPAVEQTGRGEHERARADRHDPPGPRAVQRLVDGGLDHAVAARRQVPRARHQDRVGVAQHLEAVVRGDRVAAAGRDRAAVRRADQHLVPVRQVREHVRRAAQVERDRRFEREHGEAMRHGRILSHVGCQATGCRVSHHRRWSV
ncbi:tetratricopeptide repeat protein [Lentzea tibetensis]|uniref:Tetratricopeptide repeat protein n=1 Tax=Lentzea tibetensis TaxID=2591470 RepID=A0A563EXL7_9PSEU|nr:tetratricopeptide repeat protein [Lentzea tibetensis]